MIDKQKAQAPFVQFSSMERVGLKTAGSVAELSPYDRNDLYANEPRHCRSPNCNFDCVAHRSHCDLGSFGSNKTTLASPSYWLWVGFDDGRLCRVSHIHQRLWVTQYRRLHPHSSIGPFYRLLACVCVQSFGEERDRKTPQSNGGFVFWRLCGRRNIYFAANSLSRWHCLVVFWADQLVSLKPQILITFE